MTGHTTGSLQDFQGLPSIDGEFVQESNSREL